VRLKLILWNSDMWPEVPSPVVFAHRGDSAHAPENTLPAFEFAYKAGAPAIEFDVKLTSDGHAVVIHDQKVDRTTDGHGDLRSFTLAALQELDAGVSFGDRFPGTRIPTLEQVFETVGKKIYMNVELTNYATPRDQLVSRVVDLVQKHGLETRLLFSSFYPHNLRKAAELLPSVPCGLLTWSGWLGWWGRSYGFRRQVYTALHPNINDVDAGLVSRIHASGRRVHVWTVNAPEDMKRLIGWGVDGIFTDDPGLALGFLGRGT
jgi:glycerophosphoryl diester phosphodiesterase